jgi:CRP/FNR family transcriptional regulator
MTAFARRLASDLQHADQAQEKTIHLQVRARLACFLLSLRDRHGEVDDHGNLLISLPMSRREIASTIGTRPESLSRAIRNLHDTGTAKFMGKRVVVRDLDELLDEAERS